MPGVAAMRSGLIQRVEFPLEEMPANRWEVWQGACEGIGVDLVVQRPVRGGVLLIADMDSTMIQQECIDELADEAGVGAHVAGITARAMNGELDFSRPSPARAGRFARRKFEQVIGQVIRDRITLMPGPVLLATMKANGAYAALVSGGVHRVYRGDCNAAGV